VPIDAYDLVDRFGAAVEAGAAGLFVGAGLSKATGLPDWNELLAQPRADAGIPDSVTDLPLVAEYYERASDGGRSALKAHLLRETAAAGAVPGEGHRLLGALPVRQIWTTNYDPLIEQAVPGARAVVLDDDARRVGDGAVSVIKMHGSIAPGPPPQWASEPVISRSDYERYEQERPRTWALLRASYLTRTILFLGFSFADPNIDVLLRLARTYGTATGDQHLTVLRRPTGDHGRLHDLRVADLEASGVSVCEVQSHDELVPLLRALVRRTRPPRIFVSGSGDADALLPWCDRLAQALADDLDWEIASLGGNAGWLATRQVARLRRQAGDYDPSRMLLYFRKRDEPVPEMDERVGTAVFTDLTRDELYPDVLAGCRALLVVRGSTGTAEEVAWARQTGLGVVPLAASGGAARQAWLEAGDPPLLGGRPADPATWARLDSPEPGAAVLAAVRLLRQAMYRLSA
jgi:hypothetical protein